MTESSRPLASASICSGDFLGGRPGLPFGLGGKASDLAGALPGFSAGLAALAAPFLSSGFLGAGAALAAGLVAGFF